MTRVPKSLSKTDARSDRHDDLAELAWLPYWMIRERLRTGTLITLFNSQPGFLYDCHALLPCSPRMPPKVRASVDTLAAALPKLMT